MTPILILAAGRSTRMRGTDKLLCDVGGVTLLERQIQMAAPIGPVFVTLPAPDHARIQIVGKTKATPVMVPNADDGMGVSLKYGVAALPDCATFMILLGDLISLQTNDLSDVIHNFSKPNLICRGATPDGRAGHPVVFDAVLRTAFADLSGDHGANSIIQANQGRVQLHHFSDDRALHDLDTPEDWATWKADKK